MKKSAFTLMELMVVVVIIGIIAGFALPQYQNAIRKAHERDAVIQLTSLHAGNTMYRAKNSAYLATAASLSAINSGLNINIIANDMSYNYTRSSTTAYTASALWDESGTTNDFRLVVDEGAVDATNPCCSSTTAGQCPTIADC